MNRKKFFDFSGDSENDQKGKVKKAVSKSAYPFGGFMDEIKAEIKYITLLNSLIIDNNKSLNLNSNEKKISEKDLDSMKKFKSFQEESINLLNTAYKLYLQKKLQEKNKLQEKKLEKEKAKEELKKQKGQENETRLATIEKELNAIKEELETVATIEQYLTPELMNDNTVLPKALNDQSFHLMNRLYSDYGLRLSKYKTDIGLTADQKTSNDIANKSSIELNSKLKKAGFESSSSYLNFLEKQLKSIEKKIGSDNEKGTPANTIGFDKNTGLRNTVDARNENFLLGKELTDFVKTLRDIISENTNESNASSEEIYHLSEAYKKICSQNKRYQGLKDTLNVICNETAGDTSSDPVRTPVYQLMNIILSLMEYVKQRAIDDKKATNENFNFKEYVNYLNQYLTRSDSARLVVLLLKEIFNSDFYEEFKNFEAYLLLQINSPSHNLSYVMQGDFVAPLNEVFSKMKALDFLKWAEYMKGCDIKVYTNENRFWGKAKEDTRASIYKAFQKNIKNKLHAKESVINENNQQIENENNLKTPKRPSSGFGSGDSGN